MSLENKVLNEVFSKTPLSSLKSVLSLLDPSLFELKILLEDKKFVKVLRKLNYLDKDELLRYYVKFYIEPEVSEKLDSLICSYNERAKIKVELSDFEFDNNLILEDGCRDFNQSDIRQMASSEHHFNRNLAEILGDRSISNRDTIKSTVRFITKYALNKLRELRQNTPELFIYKCLSDVDRNDFVENLIKHLVKRRVSPTRILRGVYQAIYFGLDDGTREEANQIYLDNGMTRLKKFIRKNWYNLSCPVIVEDKDVGEIFTSLINKDDLSNLLFLSLSTIRSLAKRKEIKALKRARYNSKKSFVYLYPLKSFYEYRRRFHYDKKIFLIGRDLEDLSKKIGERIYKVSEIASKEGYPSETTLRKYMKNHNGITLRHYTALLSGYGKIKVVLGSDLEEFMFNYKGLFYNASISN